MTSQVVNLIKFHYRREWARLAQMNRTTIKTTSPKDSTPWEWRDLITIPWTTFSKRSLLRMKQKRTISREIGVASLHNTTADWVMPPVILTYNKATQKRRRVMIISGTGLLNHQVQSREGQAEVGHFISILEEWRGIRLWGQLSIETVIWLSWLIYKVRTLQVDSKAHLPLHKELGISSTLLWKYRSKRSLKKVILVGTLAVPTTTSKETRPPKLKTKIKKDSI